MQAVLPHPERRLRVEAEELPDVRRVLHAQIVAAPEHAGHRVIVFLIAQRAAHAHRNAALIGHDAAAALVVQGLVHDGKAFVAAVLHAACRDVVDLVRPDGRHAHRMDDVLLEEGRRTQIVDAAGKLPV